MVYPCPGEFETCLRRIRLCVKLFVRRRRRLDDPSPFKSDLDPTPGLIWRCASYRESKNHAPPMGVEDLLSLLSHSGVGFYQRRANRVEQIGKFERL